MEFYFVTSGFGDSVFWSFLFISYKDLVRISNIKLLKVKVSANVTKKVADEQWHSYAIRL